MAGAGSWRFARLVAECQYHGPVEASCVTFDRRACCAVELFLVASQDAVNLVPVIHLPAIGTHPLPIRIVASGLFVQ